MNSKEPNVGAQLLRGHIHNLRRSRCRRDFIFSDSDRRKMSAAAVAAGMTGLGAAAAGLGNMAMDTMEDADLLEFELDGNLIKAWVWVSIFNEGDEVEVVVERDGDGWAGYGIRRVSDGIVALHPHCSRGRYAHYRASCRWFVKIFGALVGATWLLLLITACLKGISQEDILPLVLCCLAGSLGAGCIYGAIAYRISRRYIGFVLLAENIFRVFGWSDVRNIDLPALTKRSRKPEDSGLLGIFFFRY